MCSRANCLSRYTDIEWHAGKVRKAGVGSTVREAPLLPDKPYGGKTVARTWQTNITVDHVRSA